ncbi:beta-galactosidase [Edaphobacter acidisoli]|nr:beta-galactosidase [Edaphobacter acidisoli]
MHSQPPSQPSLLLGSAWYPEQWPESRWKDDVELMQKAHLHMVRVGEFAWTALEPTEGTYDLDWLERAINLAGQHGIYTVLGTPSVAPPVWMAKKYPGILVTDENGKLYTGSTRNHANWNSELYRRFVRQIDERLAERFGHNPYVIGWQIGNEYSRQSFDADTQAQFHAWLQHRYGSLAKLNAAWTTAYNNQTYSSWDEIPLVDGPGDNSPGLWLDSKRFITDSLRAYQRVQIDAIRKYADPNQKITTNLMGWYDLFDHYQIGQDLDVIAWDNPQVKGSYSPMENGATHDLMRGLKGGNYWVMETTAGPRGGGNASAMLRKGELRAAIWEYVGHGADLVSYWQWRDALNGGEANHGALVDVDGRPDPIYAEYAQLGAEFEKAGPALAGTHAQAEVALLHSYPSRWAINWQKMNPAYDPIQELMSYYTPLRQLGYTVDIVPPNRDLSRYKLVIAPGLNVLTQAEADNLTHYVEGGGHLVLAQRSGMKDEHNSRWSERQPGPLAKLLGAHVEQYMSLNDPVAVSGDWGDASASMFAEQLKVDNPDTQVLMRWLAPNSWLDGEPSAVSRTVEKGSIAYIGAWMDSATTKRAVEWMLKGSAASPDLFPVPEGVEVFHRRGADKNIFIVGNYSTSPTHVKLPRSMQDVLAGKESETLNLPAFGVAVLMAPE